MTKDTAATPKKTLPISVSVGGIPFSVVDTIDDEHRNKLACASSIYQQKIEVLEEAPFPRRLYYLMREVGHLLLDAAGYEGKAFSDAFGSVLYRLIRENSFAWLKGSTDGRKLPSTVFVNGMPYMVSIEEDRHLDDKNLLGEVSYTDICIYIHSVMKPEARDVVFLHEVTHAMLHEAHGTTINKERLVEPLSYLLYQLLMDNDFSFAYNGEAQ